MLNKSPPRHYTRRLAGFVFGWDFASSTNLPLRTHTTQAVVFYFPTYNSKNPLLREEMQIEINKLVRAKRRTIALIIEKDGSLTVRAPKRAAMLDINQFIHEKAGWILRARERLKSIIEIPKRQYMDGEQFLYLGNLYELKLVPPQRPALKFDREFKLGNTAQKRGEVFFIKWYKEQAFQVISERVAEFSKRYAFIPKQVKISSAKTRWGSCSPDGTLNFTWRLIMAPLPVVDYVVVHELVHLRVKNHSQKFWKAVEAIMPEYKTHRKWLRENGDRLGL